MLAVPVDPVAVVHIEADKDYPGASELDGQIKRLKSRIATTGNGAELMHRNVVAAHIDLNRKDAPFIVAHVRTQAQAAKVRPAPVVRPPIIVTCVKNVGPWREPIAVVYDYDSDFAARFL